MTSSGGPMTSSGDPMTSSGDPMTSSHDLLLEVGAEEIPAGFLSRALVDLSRRVPALLDEARLGAERVQCMGTPRRLTVAVTGLPDRQPDVSEEVVGPPARVAFDADGKPTKAAVGFAKRNNVAVDELRREQVPGKKGDYVVCTRKEQGRAVAEVLPGLVSDMLRDLPWSKSMRWAFEPQAFVRPVHWIVCMLDDQVLPVGLAGIAAGNTTRGHRFLAADPIAVTADLSAYASALREAFVLVDPTARRDSVVAELKRLERETGAVVRDDDALLDEVVNLVEYPVAVCGSFDESFLEVPEEVVVSAMRSHQRYFAMEDAQGAITNRFATIAGTVTRDAEVVRHGNERVLAARLADAQFFFREDQKVSLEQWAARLDAVVFQSKLGSIGAKVARMANIAATLAERVGADTGAVARAVALCKADLVTHMVGEFPDLQGIMGRHYARLAGEDDAVCAAITEHYLPRGAGDRLAESDVGAVVGVADRIDTIVGCFAAGLAPTGSADPYGLRRASLAVLAILSDRGWSVSLGELVDWAGAQVNEHTGVNVGDAQRAEVLEFFRVRLKGMLEQAPLPADCVEAALTAGFEDVPDASARAQAVAQLRQRADFEPLATAFKRIANIIKDQKIEDSPDPDAFSESEERALWQAFCEVKGRADELVGAGDYNGSLAVLAELKDPVDRFFDAVLVMHKDDKVRENRIALLGQINSTFTRIADFRRLAV